MLKTTRRVLWLSANSFEETVSIRSYQGLASNTSKNAMASESLAESRKIGARRSEERRLDRTVPLATCHRVPGHYGRLFRKHAPRPLPGWASQFVNSLEWPPGRRLRFGDLHRLSPFSRQFGFDRGTQVDRFYIESFLSRSEADIRGRVWRSETTAIRSRSV